MQQRSRPRCQRLNSGRLNAGVLHPRRHHVSSCRASFSQQPENADSGSAADSSDCIDTEWRQRRWGSLWNSLAEQDRSWAVLNYTVDGDDYNATSTVDESWDLGSGSGSSAMSVAQALWPATYSPSPGQQPWPKDKRMVCFVHTMLFIRTLQLHRVSPRLRTCHTVMLFCSVILLCICMKITIHTWNTEFTRLLGYPMGKRRCYK